MEAGGTISGTITVAGSNGFVVSVNCLAAQPGVAGSFGSQQLNPALITEYGTITSVSPGNAFGMKVGDFVADEMGGRPSPVNVDYFRLDVWRNGSMMFDTWSYLNTLFFPGAITVQTTLVPQVATTATALGPSANPSTYGQPVTFMATVTSGGDPVTTGSVTFQEGNTVLASSVPLDSNGHASFQIATLTSADSPHTITASYSGTASFHASSGSFTETVNKTPVIAIAANIVRPYGASNPALLGAVVGIQNNDPITATYSTAGTPASAVGSYAIVPSLSDGGTGTLSNYTPTITNGTLTITPAPLIVTPANVTRAFDTPNPPLTGTIVGIQNGDNITASYTTTATLTNPVGTYPITAMLRDPDNKLGNYSLALNQGSLTITADPLLVTSMADGGPGSLRDVLLSAPADSTVHFWSGVSGTITLTSGMLSLTQDVSIVGPGADLLTISGNKMLRVFQIASAATVTLSGLTIGNGNSTGSVGGGIYNDGTLTVTSSTISGNFASPRGGGIYNSPSATLTLNDSLISGNSTTNAGGGIFNEGTLTVIASTFTGNGSANADGGAIFNLGTLIVSNSTLSGNGGSGAFGGAIRNDRVLTVEQSTFSGNSANLGGAVYNVGTSVVNHSTLSDNTAAAGGGGIDNTGAAVLIARDTILAGNTITKGTGPDLSGALTSLGHNLIGNRRGGSGFVASDLLNVNPLLGPLQDNGGPTQTLALLPGSPAIDAGNNADAPEYDQRGLGYPRIVGGQIDIGAYEFQPTLTVTSSADDGQPGTLRYAIAHADNGDRILITPAVNGAIVLTQGELLLNKDLTIQVAGNSDAMVTSSISRIFEVMDGAHVVLSGLDITGQLLVGNGAGVSNHGTLLVNGGRFAGNTAVSGAAIFNYGTLSVINTQFVDNVVSPGDGSYFTGDGGAVYNTGSASFSSAGFARNVAMLGGALFNYFGQVTIDGCGFDANGSSSGGGGAIFCVTGSLKISQSQFVSNVASVAGAVYVGGSAQVTISSSVFTQNTARWAGGIYVVNNIPYHGTFLMLDCSLYANTAAYVGGAFYEDTSNVIVSRCTIQANSAGQNGGGIQMYLGNLTLSDSEVIGNSSPAGADVFFQTPGGVLTNDNSVIGIIGP
jgi:hypothetical protein